MLPFLFDHVRSPEFQVRFHWEPGSMAFWDNRSVQHYAVADYTVTMAQPVCLRTAPVVMTVHDLAFVHEPAHFTGRGMRFFRRGLELALKEADHVVCPSEATRRDRNSLTRRSALTRREAYGSPSVFTRC